MDCHQQYMLRSLAFDHELKIRRADEHLKDLGAQIKTWRDGGHYSLRHEYDLQADGFTLMADLGPMPSPTRRGSMLAGRVFIPPHSAAERPSDPPFGRGIYTVLATATEQPPNDLLGVRIGEALHNLRSGLDNLAFALAAAFTTPLPDDFAEKSEFPIFGDVSRKGTTGVGADLFRDNGRPKIQGWAPKAQAIVEGLQPYKRGDDFRSDPLWVLHELDRVNKHRLIHTTVASFEGAGWRLDKWRNVFSFGPGIAEWLRGPIKTDTPIARFVGIEAVDPSLEMYVHVEPAMDIAFTPGSPAAGSDSVIQTLWSIYNHVAGTVVPALTPFL